MLIGLDEAGMGTLAGPMTAAVVILANDTKIKGVRDSKKMTSEQREEVAARIMEVADFYKVGTRDAETIDKIGLSAAWYGLMRELAIAAHIMHSQEMVLDGNRLIGLPYVTPVVKADATHLAVSAASILAKYTQVCAMEDLHRLYPKYGFILHHGYGTVEHKNALKEYGPCPAHRKSYRPVKRLLSPSGPAPT